MRKHIHTVSAAKEPGEPDRGLLPISLRSLGHVAVLILFIGCPALAEEHVPLIGPFNEGCELYKASDFQGAEKRFGEVVAQTDDQKLKHKAYYNQGTALLAATAAGQLTNRLESVALAIDLFELSLEIQPDDLDAKQNLERALHWMVSGRIQQASKLIDEADALLAQDQAKPAKENYETAKTTLAPVDEDFAPGHKDLQPLIDRADGQLQRLEQALELTREEMENAKHAISVYEYQLAADIMLADKPERRWAFDLDENLAQEFQQMVQNNQNVINIIYPPNPLKL